MAIALTTYKGKKFSRDFADALREADRLLPTIPVRITQGGFNGNSVAASAGTHGGDAVDISVRGLTEAQVIQIILVLRSVGIAAWFRTTKRAKWGTRAHGFSSYHIHGVPNGWGSPSSGARDQALGRGGYRAGRDGLASAGLDLGPGHTGAYRTRTWAGYKATLKPGLPSTGNSTSFAKPATPKPVFPRVYPTVTSTRVAEDGVLGTQTIKRLQMTLQVLPDGKLGHFTVRALKMWLGNKDDGSGIMSPHNVTQLQHRVGAYKDGKWGTGTTKALQKYLNRNPVKP